MKYLKRFLITSLLFCLVLVLFRQSIYRHTIKYQIIDERIPLGIIEDEDLLIELELIAVEKELSVEQIVHLSANYTSQYLQYSLSPISPKPATAISTGRANCIGYSAVFAAICEELIRLESLEQDVKNEHLVAKLSFIGVDLHQFFSCQFFANHDINRITDLRTNTVYQIDPTVHDVLNINTIKSK